MANYKNGTSMSYRKLILLISILTCTLTRADGQGLEIYLIKHDLPDLTKEHSDSFCYYCFKPTKQDLFDSAFIKQIDIEYFDWENQSIKLNESGLKKINTLDIPLQGLPVAISIDKRPIYGFWLWNVVSSFGCDWVYAYPELGFKIEFGLPIGYAKGLDPRYDDKINKYLIKTKLKK
jgi:hypothetical protein